MSQTFDLSSYRRYFPALAQKVNGEQAIYNTLNEIDRVLGVLEGLSAQ